MLRPVGEDPFSLKLIETVPATIKVNGKTYFNEFKREHKSNGGVILTIGEALKLNYFPIKLQIIMFPSIFKRRSWICGLKRRNLL